MKERSCCAHILTKYIMITVINNNALMKARELNMNEAFVKAIDVVCKRSNIDLKISDIVTLVEEKETESTFPSCTFTL